MRSTVHGRTLLTASGVLALSLLALPSAPHAQAFSHGPLNATIEGGIRWNGLHAFQDVYCVRFPRADDVHNMVEGLLQGDTISYFRATYERARVKAYVVTSTLPEGRDENDEFLRLARFQQDNADRVNAFVGRERYRVSTKRGPVHPVLVVRVAGIDEYDASGGRFPIAMPLVADHATPFPHSTHRFFVRNGNRFEVAVLGEVAPVAADGALAEPDSRLEALADRITESVQRCRSLPWDYSQFAFDPATRALPTDLYPEATP